MSDGEATTLHVLVAEDDPDHRYLLVRALRRATPTAIEIHEAHDGEQTLDYIHGRGKHEGRPRPHLIFLDLKMPRVNGFEVLEDVKRDAASSDIPVVMLTSSERPADVDRAYTLGTNSYVTKNQGGPLRDVLPRIAEYWTASSKLPRPSR